MLASVARGGFDFVFGGPVVESPSCLAFKASKAVVVASSLSVRNVLALPAAS